MCFASVLQAEKDKVHQELEAAERGAASPHCRQFVPMRACFAIALGRENKIHQELEAAERAAAVFQLPRTPDTASKI